MELMGTRKKLSIRPFLKCLKSTSVNSEYFMVMGQLWVESWEDVIGFNFVISY